jgi:NAD(P)-dependent dehydrogenase (short-subunit alcohol dehydrogenase family)
MTAPAYLVTGATGALGSAVVDVLLAEGARVAAPHRSADAPPALRAKAAADRLFLGRADFGRPEDAARFANEAAAALGRLDGLAAVAGAYAGDGPLEAAPLTEWRAMMDANLETAYAACRAALPHLLKTAGRIVTVSSRRAQDGGAGAAAYAVAKAGVIALTRALAIENRDRGVRVNCVLPATIDTPDNRAAMPKADPSQWTPPDAIARLIAYLLSPRSAPLTGGLLPADGPVPRD